MNTLNSLLAGAARTMHSPRCICGHISRSHDSQPPHPCTRKCSCIAFASRKRSQDALGAIELAPKRYAIKRKRGRRNVWVLYRLEGAAYIEIAELPKWWTPEQRFAWRITYPVAQRAGNVKSEIVTKYPSVAASDSRCRIERITADLNTGEEIPT
jgi:hypothetical protein